MTKLEHFTPQRRNANKHTPRGMGELETSVQTDGWIGAITAAADGEVFDGSARREVIETALHADPIVVDIDGTRPVILRRTDIPTATDERAIRLGLAANKVAADNLSWDVAILDELRQENAALLEGLFRPEELDALLAELAAQQVDAPGLGGDEFDTTPADGPTRTAVGDLWQLGRHRLLVGDCTIKGQVDRLMDGAKADAVVTDPPYGIKAGTMTLGIGKRDFYRSDWDARRPDVRWLLERAPLVCIWGGNYFADQLPITNDWLCWWKKNDGLSFGEFELAWTNFGANTRHIAHHWSGEVKNHPTQKPLEVIVQTLGQVAASIILDPYLGAGTSIIAAERTGRTCYGMEIEPRYADVCIRRFEAETGLVAVKVDEVTA